MFDVSRPPDAVKDSLRLIVDDAAANLDMTGRRVLPTPSQGPPVPVMDDPA